MYQEQSCRRSCFGVETRQSQDVERFREQAVCHGGKNSNLYFSAVTSLNGPTNKFCDKQLFRRRGISFTQWFL